ncbi:hypothetical protein [Staphylococcus simulans]|uniref:hypothetical protein n=1 Tax=Staphylococcus simulans TaxID=1286 RepID=UPI0021D2B429|nr:hypothetical protein [Staphylococcus simulans]UXR50197.1 hypothetical protein MUA28_00980 [Staphylococcus simulans]
MSTINNELLKKIQALDEGHADLLKSLLSDLVKSNSYREEKEAREKFKNKISRYIRESGGSYEIN